MIIAPACTQPNNTQRQRACVCQVWTTAALKTTFGDQTSFYDTCTFKRYQLQSSPLPFLISLSFIDSCPALSLGNRFSGSKLFVAQEQIHKVKREHKSVSIQSHTWVVAINQFRYTHMYIYLYVHIRYTYTHVRTADITDEL